MVALDRVVPGVPGVRVDEGHANAAQVIAKNRHGDGVTVGMIGIEIESVVPLEEHRVRTDHAGSVEADFDQFEWYGYPPRSDVVPSTPPEFMTKVEPW